MYYYVSVPKVLHARVSPPTSACHTLCHTATPAHQVTQPSRYHASHPLLPLIRAGSTMRECAMVGCPRLIIIVFLRLDPCLPPTLP
jgi:hypothetical protein